MAFRTCQPIERRVPLQGRRYRASELRLADIARLERLGESEESGVPSRAPDEPHDAYRDRLRLAYDVAEQQTAGGLSWGSPEVMAAVFGTVRGQTAYLRAILRCHRPKLDRETARLLAGCLTPAEWADLGRVAFAADPVDEISELIDAEIGVRLPRDSGKAGVPWSEAVAAVCSKIKVTPGEVMKMTPTEVNLVLSEGKEADRTVRKPPKMGRDEFNQAMRARREFWRKWEREKGRKGGQ